MREYRGFKIPKIELDADKLCLKIESNYEDMIELNPMTRQDESYKLKENPLSKLNYGTGDKNDTSAVISLDLTGNVYNGLVGRSNTIRVPFVLDEFINKDIDDANELLMKKM